MKLPARRFHRQRYSLTTLIISLSNSSNLEFMLWRKTSRFCWILNDRRWIFHSYLELIVRDQNRFSKSNIWMIFPAIFYLASERSSRRTHLFNFVWNLWPHYANRLSLFFPVYFLSALVLFLWALRERSRAHFCLRWNEILAENKFLQLLQ